MFKNTINDFVNSGLLTDAFVSKGSEENESDELPKIDDTEPQDTEISQSKSYSNPHPTQKPDREPDDSLETHGGAVGNTTSGGADDSFDKGNGTSDISPGSLGSSEPVDGPSIPVDSSSPEDSEVSDTDSSDGTGEDEGNSDEGQKNRESPKEGDGSSKEKKPEEEDDDLKEEERELKEGDEDFFESSGEVVFHDTNARTQVMGEIIKAGSDFVVRIKDKKRDLVRWVKKKFRSIELAKKELSRAIGGGFSEGCDLIEFSESSSEFKEHSGGIIFEASNVLLKNEGHSSKIFDAVKEMFPSIPEEDVSEVVEDVVGAISKYGILRAMTIGVIAENLVKREVSSGKEIPTDQKD